MLRLCFFLILISFSSFTILPQENQNWKWSHNKPQGNSLHWVKMFDNNNWAAVGYSGTFIKTSDAGVTWFVTHHAGTANPDGTYEDLFSAYFRNPDTGFVVGRRGVFTTVDGGVSFQPLADPLPSTNGYRSVYMLNNMTGFVAGTKLAKTTDGGFSWTIIPTPASISDVASPDENLILALASRKIYRSTNGGVSFDSIAPAGMLMPTRLIMKDNLTGYICDIGKIYMTSDGGLTWSIISTGLPNWPYADLDIVGNDLYVTGPRLNFYKTSNDGINWIPVPIPYQEFSEGYYSTSFFNDRFLTVAAHGIMLLKIGDNPAVPISEYLTQGSFNAIWADNISGRVIAVIAAANQYNPYDKVIYSTNGGMNWALSTFNGISNVYPFSITDSLPVNYNVNIRDLDMITNNLGYIVGNGGILFRTTNGGISWDSLISPAPANINLFDVEFISPQTGWVFGSGGKLWRTTNSGTSWLYQGIVSNDITCASMVDSLNGWTSINNNLLFYTSDGGSTWNAKTSPLSSIYDIKATNANTVFICGIQKKAAKTTDGGVTWTNFTLPANWDANTPLYSIEFADENHILIGAFGGLIATTKDGGDTWSSEWTGGDGAINCIKVIPGATPDKRTVFAGGTYGNLFKNSSFTTAVELTSFNAKISGSSIILNWSTSTETNNKGFAVERKNSENIFTEIAFINGKGTTTQLQNYSYSDNISAGKYTYRLKQVDLDGSVSFSSEIEAEIKLPSVYEISQNYPNPFNPGTIIKYSVPVDGIVRIAVYNTLGEKVSELVNQFVKAGSYEINFNANRLSSGVYFYKLESGTFVQTKKMTILK